MNIRIGIKRWHLSTYQPISPAIDDAFRKLFISFYRNKFDILHLLDVALPEFNIEGFKYLENNQDFETTKIFFQNLRIVWAIYEEQSRFFDAETFLERYLITLESEERIRPLRVHKGPLYYFWGGTALYQGDLDKAFLLMHTAYQEEIRIEEEQPTPSYKFVSLNYSDENQYFGIWVRYFSEYLDKFFVAYRLSIKNHYILDNFRDDFLLANPNPDIVFSFTYTLARLCQLSRFDKSYLNSDFAGQYKINLLFDLVLVIENSIRLKHPKFRKDVLLIPKLLGFLSSKLSWNLSEGHITNGVKTKSNNNYDQCLVDLLNRQFHFTHDLINPNLESDLAIAYLVRNRGAHDLSSSKAINLHFDSLLQSLFNVLLLTADVLY